MTIRPMTAADITTVREVDARAFTRGGNPLRYRTIDNLSANRAVDPDGCFVADDGGEIIGYIFSRRWGHWGWVGTFGVAPGRRGEGVGHKLLDAAVAHLRAGDCITIGLEVYPAFPDNVGLFTDAGFQPATSTFVLQKPVELTRPYAPHALATLSDARDLAPFVKVGRAALPGLDLTTEAENALACGWGHVLALSTTVPMAGAIVRTVPRHEVAPTNILDVYALTATPDGRPFLAEIVQALEAYATGNNYAAVRLPINTVDAETTRWLVHHGFRVQAVRLRMVLVGEYPCPPGLEMSRWAM